MDVIQMARELGAELQKSDEYSAYMVAHEAAEKDDELQELIKEFNLQKLNLTNESQLAARDSEKIKALNAELRETYAKVMEWPAMVAFDCAKKDLDDIVSFVQHIIDASASGEDPATVQQPSCGGDCSGCSGCH